MRQPGESENFYRCGWAGFLHGFAVVVDQRFHLAAVIAANEGVADFQRADLHNDGRSRSAPGFHLRFDDRPARRGRGRGLQFHYLRLQRHHLQQVVDAGSLRRGNFADDRVAAPVFWAQFAFLQLLFHPIDVRPGNIDLVDRDHDFHMLGRLRMIDRLDSLRHQAVIRGHYQHHDIGHVRPTSAHRGEGRVTRRVEKSNTRAFVFDRVSTDVLGNSARFARGDARLPDRVHERRLAVIHVAHERDDRSTGLEFFFGLDHRRRRRHDHFLDLMDTAALFAAFHFEDETVRFANLGRNIGLDRLVLIGENVQLHQLTDQDVILNPELRCQIMHDDGRLDVNDLLFHRGLGGGGIFRDPFDRLLLWGSLDYRRRRRRCGRRTGNQISYLRRHAHDRRRRRRLYLLRRSRLWRLDDAGNGRQERTCGGRGPLGAFWARLLFVN